MTEPNVADGPRAGIARSDPAREAWTEERCHILEISGAAEDPGLSIARARVEPGVTTTWHVVSIAERYLVVSGRGRMELGRDGPDVIREDVGPGDVVRIPAGVPQRISNTGEDDLVFYCLCTPAWSQDAYRSLE